MDAAIESGLHQVLPNTTNTHNDTVFDESADISMTGDTHSKIDSSLESDDHKETYFKTVQDCEAITTCADATTGIKSVNEINGQLVSPPSDDQNTSVQESSDVEVRECVADNRQVSVALSADDEYRLSVSDADSSLLGSHSSSCSSLGSLDDISLDMNNVVFGESQVDEPSASRLARRLFYLEGFKRSDVAYHLTRK